ncbi:MAG: outer membrane protein assembly factor BamD, partial [Candidatus Binatia bacterium]
PFVLYRIGQSYFDQFTATDRDQKNTEIAKGYFETVITNHPKSPYAAEARDKLAKTLEYLAESQFNVAHFYFQQEKYPAARDRLDEIVRKYRDTPTAVKSLFYLGECYRKEKNAVKAALAYEALVQHYPKSKFAPEAKTQLAQLEKEKHDPLAMLLMRDRRPGSPAAPAPERGQDPALAKLKELNLVAKTEVVYEEPGAGKGFFGRMVDKINPFSSDNGNKDEKQRETGVELLAKKKASEKEQSSGILAWLNPFSGGNSKGKQGAAGDSKSDASNLVDRIDDSLQQKGIDPSDRQAALKPPAEALPKVEEKPPQTMDTGELLSAIDSNLKKAGKQPGEMPPPPEPAEGLKKPAADHTAAAKQAAKPEPSESPVTSGLLSSIDQKLKSQGVEPSQFQASPAPVETRAAPPKQQSQKVELEPKLSVERGPLFLPRSEVPGDEKTSAAQEPDQRGKTPAVPDAPQEPAGRGIPSSVVKGPSQPKPAAPPAKAPEVKKKPATDQEEEPKGVFDQMKEDAESIGRILNPFRW